jgi:hypothetical protein
MSPIHRSIRLMLVAAAVTLVACGDGSTGPATDPVVVPPPGQQPPPAPIRSVVGRWGTHRLDDQALPARIAGGIEDGVTWELRAVFDTLVIHADGRWEQRARVRQEQSDGVQFGGTFYDKGRWTRQGDVLHFDSEWIQNVRFDGVLSESGELVVDHDFTLDETLPPMRRKMQR